MAPPIDVSRFEQLKASGDLPSPKGVALAVMRLTQQEDVTIASLANVIKTDPAFVGRLIKAANGIIGYGRRPVASVQDALTVLGLPAVRNMALGFSLLTHYRSGACEGFDYGRYWAESLLSAVAMQAITLRTRAAAADEMYCLGLLARVGEIALATLYPHDYSRIAQEYGGKDVQRLLELESRAFAMTNAELGAAMLADWGLPRIFTDAAYAVASAALSDFEEGRREFTVTYSLVLSREVARYCLSTEAERPRYKHRLLIEASRLGFDEDTLTTLLNGVAAEWLEWGALLSIHAETLPPFESIAAEAPETEAPESQEPVMRALVVDVDQATCQNVVSALGEAGFQTVQSHDGFSAAEMALDFMPNLMLIGESLPDMSGSELVRIIRKTRIGRALYILIMARDVQEEVVVNALEAGADDALPKPINLRVLLAKIGASKRLSDLHREIEQDREDIRHFAAELAVSNRRLQNAAMTDALTGLPNRRAFTEHLTQEWAAALRNKRPLGCILVDVDHFKGINDTHGHDAGDAVLIAVAQTIRASVRSQDILARLGGDEFVVICPDTSIEAAMSCAQRICEAMRVQMQAGQHPWTEKVTVSVGAACRDATMSDADSLLKRTDDSLYAAKQHGRNCVAALQLPVSRVNVAGSA